MALVTWVGRIAAQTVANSPLDEPLVDGMRLDLDHLRQWIGKSYYAGAVEDHDHDDVNSKTVVLGDRSIAAVKIMANAITSSEMGLNSVGSLVIIAESVGSGNLKTDSVIVGNSGTLSMSVTWAPSASLRTVGVSSGAANVSAYINNTLVAPGNNGLITGVITDGAPTTFKYIEGGAGTWVVEYIKLAAAST